MPGGILRRFWISREWEPEFFDWIRRKEIKETNFWLPVSISLFKNQRQLASKAYLADAEGLAFEREA